MSLAHIEMQRKDDYIDDLGSSGRPNVDSLLRREEEEEGTEPSPKRMRTAAEGKHSETDERSLFGLNTLEGGATAGLTRPTRPVINSFAASMGLMPQQPQRGMSLGFPNEAFSPGLSIQNILLGNQLQSTAGLAVTNPLLAQALSLNLQQDALLAAQSASQQQNAYTAALLSQQGLLTNPTASAAAALYGIPLSPAALASPTAAAIGASSITLPTSLAAAVPEPAVDIEAAQRRFSSSLAENSSDAAAETDLQDREPVQLYISRDEDTLSEYQCVARKQIEFFEASWDDVESNVQGRNKPIILGQVGIRCRHCTMLPPMHRARGAIYYPTKLHGIYQACQNMTSSHLLEHCLHVPDNIRDELLKLKDRKKSIGGGKKYWGEAAAFVGVYEDEEDQVLRFK